MQFRLFLKSQEEATINLLFTPEIKFEIQNITTRRFDNVEFS